MSVGDPTRPAGSAPAQVAGARFGGQCAPALGVMSSYRVGYSGISGNPVDFPCLTFVGGKCLLESAGGWRNIRNYKPDKDRATIQSFVAVELATAIFELANGRRGHGAIAGACKVETPLMGVGIVEPKAQPFEMSTWPISLEFDKVGTAAPYFLDGRYAHHFDPCGGAR
jgi:hypothetical protein